MIEPLMATMLGVVTTDAAVAPALLQRALKAAVDDTFNAITVDGECSTNDCVFVLANGASGVELTENDWPLLVASLRAACEPLAIGIVRGGEGATKLITVRVTGARVGRRRPADGARDRQLAARQDRRPRRRSELGPPGRRRRALRDRRSRSRGPSSGSVRSTLFADGTPYDERAPRGGRVPPGARRSTSRSISAPAGRGSRGCGRAT